MSQEDFKQELPSIMDYYISYENQCRHYDNNLYDKTKGSDMNPSCLEEQNSIMNIKKYVTNKSLEKLKRYIIEASKKNSEKLIFNPDHEDQLKSSYITKDIDLFKNLLKKLGVKHLETNDKLKKAYLLLESKNFTICYPVLEKFVENTKTGRKKKHLKKPVVTFLCSFSDDNKLIVSKYFVNFDAFKILLAWLLDIESDNISYIINQEEITSVFSNLNSYKNENLLDIISYVYKTFSEEFNSNKRFEDFKSYGQWVKTEKLFIIVDELEEMYVPIFEEEILNIKKYYEKNNHLPTLLKRYLGYEKISHEFIIDKNVPYFHLGSYTNSYPINLKQWHTLSCMNNTELLAISGPPGTGKTTLLKEIIANEFTLKAVKIDACWNNKWGELDDITVSPLGGTNQNSVVITSTNNKAIENIGGELSKEINFCKAFLGDNRFNGTFCAQLGKSKNFKNFIDLCRSFMVGLKAAEYNHEEADITRKNFKSIYSKILDINQKLELLYKQKTAVSENINKINSQFGIKGTTPSEIMEKLKNNLDELTTQDNQLTAIMEEKKRNISAANIRVEELTDKLFGLKEEIKLSKQKINQVKQQLRNQQEDCDKYYQYSKWGIFKVFSPSWRKLHKTYSSLNYINNLITLSNNEIQELQRQINSKELSIPYKEKEIQKINRISNNHKENLGVIEQNKRRIQEEYEIVSSLVVDITKGFTVLQDTFKYIKTKTNITEHFNWEINWHSIANSEVVLELRYLLFNESIKLLEQFILCNKDKILKNLNIILETRSDNYDNGWFNRFYNKDTDLALEQILALWETIFLCFPVITTTLHSFKGPYSNFKQLFPKMFDLLLVDEAGQIMPHYLCGPMFRACRSVVVGDESQIKPIRTVKDDFLDKYNNIGTSHKKQLCLFKNSAQSYANNGSGIFEFLNSHRAGIVLNEHRRCECSIMEFSNKHVYGGQLILHNNDNYNKPFGNNLVAIDVRGIKDYREHYNQMEINACSRVVKYILDNYNGQINNNIAIISPFRKHADLLKTVTGVDCGTVNSFQGQERKCILFSTVFDSADKHADIINFIDGTANLLNVALSRAKEQFILVGNLDEISKCKGYLKLAYEIIKEKGKILSLYGPEVDQLSDEDLQLLCSLLGESPKDATDPVGKYLEQNFPKGIIDTPAKHHHLLNFIISNLESSLFISSPWITEDVVNRQFLECLQQLLKQNKDILIHYGYRKVNHSTNTFNMSFVNKILNADYTGQKYKEKAERGIIDLHTLLKEKLIYKPTHAKILIIDKKYAIIGSFNWLSNPGQLARKEVSCIISREDSVSFLIEKLKL